MTKQVGDDDRKSRIVTTKRTRGQITQGGWCGGVVHVDGVCLVGSETAGFVAVSSNDELPA